jgi:hypothetical protein
MAAHTCSNSNTIFNSRFRNGRRRCFTRLRSGIYRKRKLKLTQKQIVFCCLIIIDFILKCKDWPLYVKVKEVIVLVPALLGLKGNLEMTLASRLSTQVNLGLIRDKKTIRRSVLGNFFILNLITFLKFGYIFEKIIGNFGITQVNLIILKIGKILANK